MKDFLNIVYLLVGVSSCLFLYLLISPTSGETSEPHAFCGTTNEFNYSRSQLRHYGNPRVGKTLFRNYCAMCHNKDMKSDLTGPALEGSLNRWNRDTTQLQLYFSDSPAYLDSTTDLRLIELRETWKPTISHKFQLSMQEVKDIMSYVEGSY